MQSWTNVAAAAAAARQPRRTTVRSEFTVGTSLLVSSCFGLSVGLDGSYKPLVGRRQCFTDACVFVCMSSTQPHSATFKCVWTRESLSFFKVSSVIDFKVFH